MPRWFIEGLYVLGTTKQHLKHWIDFVNKQYTVSFTIYQSEKMYNKIDWHTVEEFWNGNQDVACRASVVIGNIIVNTFFFTEEEIENDITPTEITSIEQHQQLMKYMQGISGVLNKTVRLTPENDAQNWLIEATQYGLVFAGTHL